MSVEALVDALWPDEPPSDAIGSLRSKLSRLRPRLPEGALVFEHGGYVLKVEHGDCDIDGFVADVTDATDPTADVQHRLAAANRAIAWWGTAKSLGSGRGVPIGRSAEAVRLEAERDRVAIERVSLLIEAGHAASAVVDGAALADEQPYSDRLCELRMRALHRSGRSVDALRLFESYRKRLADDVGVVPSRALAEYEATVLDGGDATSERAAPPSSATQKPPTANGSTNARDPGGSVNGPTREAHHRPPLPWFDTVSMRPEFIGREPLLSTLQHGLAANRAVLLTGDPGIGRTRIIASVVDWARRHGRAVIALRCPPEPHALFAALDRLLLGTPDAAVIQDRSEAVARRSSALIARLTEASPGALITIDDIQWADPGTIECLQSLADARDLGYLPPFSVLIARRTSPQTSPIDAALELVIRTFGCDLTPVPALDESEITHLVVAAAKQRPSPKLRNVLCHASGGNPLLALHALADLVARGEIALGPQGLETSGDATGGSVPGDLEALVGTTLRLASPQQAELLFELASEEHGIARDDERFAQAVAVAELLPGVLVASSARVGFAQPTVQRVVAAIDDPIRRRERHAVLAAAALEQASMGDDEAALAFAHHHMSVGAPAADSRAVDALQRAGRRHLALTDWESASRVLAVAVHHAGRLRYPEQDPGTWTSLAADAASAAFHSHDAEATHELVASIDSSIDAPPEVLAEITALAVRAQLTMTREVPRIDEDAVLALVHRLDARPDHAARLLALLAEYRAVTNDPMGAEELTERALRMAQHGSPRVLAEVAFARGLVSLATLDVIAAERHFRFADRTAASTAEFWVRSWTSGRLGYLAFLREPRIAAKAALEDARRHQTTACAWAELSVTAALDAQLASFDQDDSESALRLAESERLMRRSGYPYTAPLVFAPRLHRAIVAEDRDAADRVITDWDECAGKVPTVARAACELLHGSVSSAAGVLRRAPTTASMATLPVLGLHALIAERSGLSDTLTPIRQHLRRLGIQRLPGAPFDLET